MRWTLETLGAQFIVGGFMWGFCARACSLWSILLLGLQTYARADYASVTDRGRSPAAGLALT